MPGLWYWIVLAKPANYWLAKAIGNEEDKLDADEAMKKIVSASAVFLVVAIIGGVAYLISKALGLIG